MELMGDRMVFKCPEVHAEAEMSIGFQRTLRIPDDGKTYPLPPGLGAFPICRVDDHRDRVPAGWVEHGGVMVPMFQAEALWARFTPGSPYGRASAYPFAIKVSAGKVSAVTGEPWQSGLRASDYLVVPGQPWIDGFVVERGKIRQFVAMPLGWGLTVEQQLTGREEHGGIQIEVFPMKAAEYERRFPCREILTGEYKTSGGVLRSFNCDAPGTRYHRRSTYGAHVSADMGLGAGGTMKQDIYLDTFGPDVWDTDHGQRVFVHLANSFAWEAITGQKAPPSPCTARAYSDRGLPWFDYYAEGMPIAPGGRNLAAIRSVLAMGFQKGLSVLPENQSVDVPPACVVQRVQPMAGVRDGRW